MIENSFKLTETILVNYVSCKCSSSENFQLLLFLAFKQMKGIDGIR